MNRLLLVTLFSITPVLAHGATYYVAKTGSDGRTCTQAQLASTPKTTIKAGLACLAAGDTLEIGAGTYAEAIEPLTIPSGISDGQRTIVKAGSGELVTLTGRNSNTDAMTILDRSYITIDGLFFSGGRTRIGASNTNGLPGSHYITFQNGGVSNVDQAGYPDGGQSAIIHTGITGAAHTHIVYRNLDVSGAGPTTGHGIYANGISDSIIENCNIHNNRGHGIHQYNSGGANNMNRNIYRNNRVHDNGSFGILVGYGNDNLIYNNLVYHNGIITSGAGGMRINYGAVNGTRFYNNTVYNNTGVCIQDDSDTVAKIRNNICYQNSNNAVTDLTGGAIKSNNLLSNPFFVDALGLNFALSADSPAIDKGMTISEVPNDFNGVPRPQGVFPDIGAFENTSTQQAQPPPTNLRFAGSN